MQINLYRNLSENNKIGKQLNQIAIIQAYLKEQTSALDIILEIQQSENILNNVNYIYIPFLGRYYFVVDKDIVTNGICRLLCHTDVLESFKTDIKALQIIADKAEQTDKIDLFIDDNSFVTENRLVNDIYNFPNGFNNNGEYILITVGG